MIANYVYLGRKAFICTLKVFKQKKINIFFNCKKFQKTLKFTQ